MSALCSEQGRTRVYAEAYFSYVAGENPRRTPLRGKRAIYGWKLDQPLGFGIALFSGRKFETIITKTRKRKNAKLFHSEAEMIFGGEA